MIGGLWRCGFLRGMLFSQVGIRSHLLELSIDGFIDLNRPRDGHVVWSEPDLTVIGGLLEFCVLFLPWGGKAYPLPRRKAVPDLTFPTIIQLNERVSLRRLRMAIRFPAVARLALRHRSRDERPSPHATASPIQGPAIEL
jgi:hypothetical protein